MWMILGIVIAVAGTFITEAPALLKKESMKDFRVFSVLLFFGTGLSFALSFNVAVPNPIDWIEFVYKPITVWFQTTFK
ncbi:hypothetical protein H7992_05230 [Sporosarcina sp. resist]|uniref:hypothetical protein n=1 Tax=Sporosarcina sp. resist TaxID=2762563 RepID=UPI00164DE4D4|nr:hypothetical protein [Sporosarcina sp. resist]QNK89128.1 hypothetical protein H7992_05230 [Sporosarcina sp. resist]